MPGTLRDAPTALYRALLRADGAGGVPLAMEGVGRPPADIPGRDAGATGWGTWAHPAHPAHPVPMSLSSLAELGSVKTVGRCPTPYELR